VDLKNQSWLEVGKKNIQVQRGHDCWVKRHCKARYSMICPLNQLPFHGQPDWDSRKGRGKDLDNRGFSLDTQAPSFYIQPTG
jgi:hypothetical protein